MRRRRFKNLSCLKNSEPADIFLALSHNVFIMTIDAEVHFWKYGKATGATPIRNNKIMQEDYLPSGISLNLQRNRVDACIAVAAEPAEVETRFLAELALTHPVIRAVIGWIDLKEKNAGERIEKLSAYTAIKGFKLDVSGENFFPSEEVMQALAQHSYCPGSETFFRYQYAAAERPYPFIPGSAFRAGTMRKSGCKTASVCLMDSADPTAGEKSKPVL